MPDDAVVRGGKQATIEVLEVGGVDEGGLPRWGVGPPRIIFGSVKDVERSLGTGSDDKVVAVNGDSSFGFGLQRQVRDFPAVPVVA